MLMKGESSGTLSSGHTLMGRRHSDNLNSDLGQHPGYLQAQIRSHWSLTVLCLHEFTSVHRYGSPEVLVVHLALSSARRSVPVSCQWRAGAQECHIFSTPRCSLVVVFQLHKMRGTRQASRGHVELVQTEANSTFHFPSQTASIGISPHSSPTISIAVNIQQRNVPTDRTVCDSKT